MALAKPDDSSFKLSASPAWLTMTPLGRSLHYRQIVDLAHGVAKRRQADEIGGDGGLAVAIIAVDAGRSLVEFDVGDCRKRHTAAAAHRHPQLLDAFAGPRVRGLELNPDGDQSVAGVEFCQRGTDVADGCDPNRLRQGFRSTRQVGPKGRSADGYGAPAGRATSPRSRWRSAGCAASDCASSSGNACYDRPVRPGHDQRYGAQAVLVDEPIADVGNAIEIAPDGEFEIALRNRAVALGRVIDDERGAANLATLLGDFPPLTKTLFTSGRYAAVRRCPRSPVRYRSVAIRVAARSRAASARYPAPAGTLSATARCSRSTPRTTQDRPK